MALFRQGPQQQERRVQGGMKNRDFRPISRFISVIMQVSSYYGRQIWNRVHASNGAIFNDFQWSLAHISRSRYHLTSNNSKMVQDRTDSFTIMALYKFTYLLTYAYNGRPIVSRIMIYRKAPYLATLNDPYPRFQGHTITWCWISQKNGTRYRHSFNGILIGTYTRLT